MSDSVYEMARENQSSKSLFGSKTSVTSKKSSYVNCRICLSNILDPACLTCGHKFCERCLEKYWNSRDRPDFIICPLCRTYAFNVDFTKKDPPSTEDFRKAFHPLEDIVESEEDHSSISCVKFSILLPAMYYLLKWLGSPIMERLTKH